MTYIATFDATHFGGVKALWEEVFPHDPPWNRAEIVIPAKARSQPDLFTVALDGRLVVGAALAGYDGHRAWLYSVAVRERYRHRQIGSALVRDMERRLVELGARKINLQVLDLNLALVTFYHRLGYAAEDRISMGRRL